MGSSDTGDVAVTPDHPSWSTSRVAAWMIDHQGRRDSLATLVRGMCEHLVQQGIPLFGVSVGIRSVHPEVVARNVRWRIGQEGVEEIDRALSIEQSRALTESPVFLIRQGAGGIRRRLCDSEVLMDFPILHELKAEGCTDYVIMPLQQSNGERNFVSWTTLKPGGFSSAHLAQLYDLLPIIALRVELASAYEATRTLLTTYLGGEPARRVLAGTVRRGQVENLRAAIWFSDLKGFTRFADRHEGSAVVELIDYYFGVVGDVIEESGGEILKFLGDGILAVFTAETSDAEACARALNAAITAHQRLLEGNTVRHAAGQPTLNSSIGLHLGTVQFGNIGAHDRLDFTVIGQAVNEAARVQDYCKRLDRNMLTTAPFAEALTSRPGPRLESVGFHALRGVVEAQEIFALPRTSIDNI